MKCVGSEINIYSNKKYWQQYEEMVHRKRNGWTTSLIIGDMLIKLLWYTIFHWLIWQRSKSFKSHCWQRDGKQTSHTLIKDYTLTRVCKIVLSEFIKFMNILTFWPNKSFCIQVHKMSQGHIYNDIYYSTLCAHFLSYVQRRGFKATAKCMGPYSCFFCGRQENIVVKSICPQIRFLIV